MKKSFLFIVVILIFGIRSNAQTADQVKANFKTLVIEAATDFKNVQKEVLEIDTSTRTEYYACNKSLGSTFEAICVNANDNTTYFSSKFEYSKTSELIKANEILPGILDEVNAMVKSGKYKGRDYDKNENVSITEVKDLEGNYIIEIESRTDKVNSNSSYLMVVIYGKSWGKK
jgi:hypothetical protein